MTSRPPIDVDAALRSLAASLDGPPAPDYAARVLAVLGDENAAPHPRFRRARRVPRLLVAAAVLLLAVVATTLAVPATRHTLASWFGFPGIDIRSAPSSAARPSAPGPVPLRAGRQVTLEQAGTATRGRLRLPSGAGPPDRVLEYRDEGATVITLAYLTAPGLEPTPDTGFALLVTEVFDAGEPLLVKMMQTGATSTQVQVHDAAGVFIRGPQELMILDHTRVRHGEEVLHEVVPRESADTIIWADADGTYRIEADMSRAQAISLAEGVR